MQATQPWRRVHGTARPTNLLTSRIPNLLPQKTNLASRRLQKHRYTMKHFLTRLREESTVIESASPKLNRFKYAAMLLGALAVAATPLGYPAIANAEPGSGTWDIEQFDDCVRRESPPHPEDFGWDRSMATRKTCCLESGGVWRETITGRGVCEAPPGDSKGSRQLPGGVQVPSDLATAPTVTKAPPRPIQVPSDIATVSTVSQAPA